MELPVTAVPADDLRARRTSLDALRGLVMVIMALDHVRDFIHHDAMLRQPEDLATTTPLLFFTRWITHLVAPTFSLAAGIGAYLWWRRGRTRGELSRFLATRGLWLVVLEVTVMRLAYNFTPSLQYPLLLLVLWVLGLSMLLLAALVWLPPRALAVLSLAVIALHNLLDGIRAADLGAAAPLWNFLHQPGAFPVGGLLVIIGYPLIPWAFVMALGFAAGMLYEWPAAERERHLVRVGLAMIAAFVVLRALNLYGDPAPWSRQDSAVFTLLSFLKTTKYPPSLLFLLMTLGPACLLLAAFERARLSPGHPLVIFGRVPISQMEPTQIVFQEKLAPSTLALQLQAAYSWLLALVGLILLSPVILATALAVRLSSPGPVLFRQTRTGKNNIPFMLYKFRSMYVDAEARTGAVWAQENDPRVTPIGRALHKYRLDELPQLFNVLRGEMAIVGPRPERPEFIQMLAKEIPLYMQRLAVKPGITGWAQINYRYGNTVEDTVMKLEYDLYYIKNFSPQLDFYVMFHTIKTMLLTRGAY